MLTINPVKFAMSNSKSNKDNTAQSYEATASKNSCFLGMNIFAQQNRAMVKFGAGFFNLPAGALNKDFGKFIKQAKAGDVDPLITYLRGGQISSTPEHKKAVQEAISSVPKNRGDIIDNLQEALDVINEKLQGKG